MAVRRKPTIIDSALGAATKAKNDQRRSSPVASAPNKNEPYSASAVNLRQSDWDLLRRVAWARAEKKWARAEKAGRPSMSKVIESLIDAARKELQKEIG